MFYSSYVKTYIDRDINELGNVKDKLKFTQFLTAMAARTGQMLNYSNVAEQIEMSVNTVKEWTSLLEASGIIYIMHPFSNSALNRAIKTPKVYFRDTGLVCFLTKYQTADTAMNGANAGIDYRMNVSYYRVKDKQRRVEAGNNTVKELENDLIIEQNEVIYPIEIKMSANPKLSMTNAFDVLDKIHGKKRGIGVILCMYDSPLWLKDNIVALPIEYI